MANRNFDVAWSIGKRLIDIIGSFVPLTGAGTIVASSVKGLGFGYAPVAGVMALQTTGRPGITSGPGGILRTGVGMYTIQADDSYQDLNFFDCTLAAANTSGTGLWAQPVNNATGFTPGVGPTVTMLIVNSSGTPTEATAGQRVYFDLQLRDSTTQFNKP